MKFYAWPEWARQQCHPEALTEIEQQRIRLNAHIPIALLARLMGRDEKTVSKWARANGIGRVSRGWRSQRNGTYRPPPAVKRRYRRAELKPADEVAHLVNLARIARRGGK